MGGEKIPVVFFPRFTTIAGDGIDYYTQPIDMLPFDGGNVEFYRSVITGGGTPAMQFVVQESVDLIVWDDVGTPFDPSSGTNVEGSVPFPFSVARRYMRVGVKIVTGTNPSVTIWAQGWASRTQQ